MRAFGCQMMTLGWFSAPRAFSRVARYLDEGFGSFDSALDFLSHSHGEGFLRFFEERCQRQGLFIFDEPESASSPARQMEFLKLMRRMEEIGHCQIIMATHSPMLMAYPNARLLRLNEGRTWGAGEREGHRPLQGDARVLPTIRRGLSRRCSRSDVRPSRTRHRQEFGIHRLP